MTHPKNASDDNGLATAAFSHTKEEQMIPEAAHYSPTDYDGDYHVEQDDETDD